MRLSKTTARRALVAGMWISWGVVVPILYFAVTSPSIALKVALIGIAASLVSTGFSQFGILAQLKSNDNRKNAP